VLRKLLICGLVAGFIAGLAAFGFMTVAGEPAIDQAIAYEEAHSAPGDQAAAPVSRGTQKGLGLLTAASVYGLALGGIFALVFAYAYGRVVRASPARTALLLAAAAFVVIYLIPFVKYPPNPPAVGDPDTIGNRTALYLVMVWISILAAIAALRLRRTLAERRPPEVATALAGAAYLAVVLVAGLALPGVHEIPKTFPATTLWRFREASVGAQLVMWTSIGLVFSVMAQRVMTGRSLRSLTGRRRAAATAGE
jgi:predicted cobalt transporter CbtA